MADQNNSSSIGDPPPNRRRRSSIADLFTPKSSSASSISTSPPANAVPSTPGVPHLRGMSITTLGLGNTGTGPKSPYTAFAKQRRASISTSSAASSPEFRNSFDDGAVIEEDDQMKATINPPASPSFARRVSFGAQALRDVRQTGGTTVHGGGEGFNWPESLRDKTKRSASFSSNNPFAANHNRTRSVSATAPEPPKEMPKAVPVPTPTKMKKPDHMGERILRGDFMMD